MTRVSFTTCTLVFLISSVVYPQEQYTLSGIIEDQNNIPVASGNVHLLGLDQTLVQYIPIVDGKFNFPYIANGEYTITINSQGYQSKTQTILLQNHTSLHIILQENRTSLDEVTIKTIKNHTSIHDGTIKFTIENSVFESLPTVMDLLSKLPGVQISANRESIFLIGKGTPLIYLENQRIDINQLISLPVENIKDIEIMDTPSPKYETEGRSLILITLKSDRKEGYKIMISEIASLKRKFTNYAGFNANFKKKKLELRSNFNYNQIGFWEGVDSEIEIPEFMISSKDKTTSIGPRPQFIMGSGFFYQFAENTYISGQSNLRTQTDQFPVRNKAFFNQDYMESSIETRSDSNEQRTFLSSNLNFNHQLTHDSNLFFGLQYSDYSRALKNAIFNSIHNSEFQLFQNRDQKFQIRILAAKIDLEKKFSKKFQIEMGGSISMSDGKAFSNYQEINPISISISDYEYQEDIYSSYAQLNGTIRKINYSAGIRSETNRIQGGFKNDPELLIDRDKTILFPKATINIPIDDLRNISFSYAKTISRPKYLNASSISTYISPFSEYSRNINLKPTITEETTAKFQYKKYLLSLSYFAYKNPDFTSIEYNQLENRVITSPDNFEKEAGYHIKLYHTATYKFWNTTNSISVIESKVTDPSAILFTTKPYLYYYSNNEFTLSPKTTVGLNFWGISKQYLGVYIRNPLCIIGASFSKTFFEDLDIAVNFNDIFRNLNYKEVSITNGIKNESIFHADAHEIALSLTYSFGNVIKSSFKNKDLDNNLDRIK